MDVRGQEAQAEPREAVEGRGKGPQTGQWVEFADPEDVCSRGAAAGTGRALPKRTPNSKGPLIMADAPKNEKSGGRHAKNRPTTPDESRQMQNQKMPDAAEQPAMERGERMETGKAIARRQGLGRCPGRRRRRCRKGMTPARMTFS